MRKFGLMLVVLLAAAAQSALAQEGLLEGLKIVRACTGDVIRLCAGVVPGDGRIKSCVKDKFSQLSPPCFDTILTAVAAETEPPPDYAAEATVKRFNTLRGMRYCEVFLIGASPATDSLYADFFNTTGTMPPTPEIPAHRAFGPRSIPKRSRNNSTCLGSSRTVPGAGQWSGSSCRRARY